MGGTEIGFTQMVISLEPVLQFTGAVNGRDAQEQDPWPLRHLGADTNIDPVRLAERALCVASSKDHLAIQPMFCQ